MKQQFPFNIVEEIETQEVIIMEATSEKQRLTEGLIKDLVRADMVEYLKVDINKLKRHYRYS